MIGKEIGPYRIIEMIGQGGMGVVYKGVHLKLEQVVAIKSLTPEFSLDPSMRERFINEAKLLAKISHPNVVNVLNYVEEGGNLFLVMEFMQGETLNNRLQMSGNNPDAVNACISVLSALDFMHSRGIIHRDIKPANIMFLKDGSVKVMDFGIAKVAGERGLTRTGMRVGTLWYMSPEQIRGEEATEVSDLYSVGVTLYEMITGKPPFDGDSEYMVMKAHLEEQPVPPWEINENVPKEIGRVVLKALAKDKKDRYQSARDFAMDLRAASGRAPEGAVPFAPLPAQMKFTLPRITATISRLNRRVLFLILICLGVLLAGIALLPVFQHKNEGALPLSKPLPSIPAPLPVQQPVRNMEAAPAPSTPPQGVKKEEAASQPEKKHKKRLAKKKSDSGAETSSTNSHVKPDSVVNWKDLGNSIKNTFKSTFKGGDKKEEQIGGMSQH